MARALKAAERAVLAHVVIDPDAWWAHATDNYKGSEEDALKAKVARWKGSYDKEKAEEGYKTRAQKQPV
tara:strand:- start:16085 stop:16291 length:207 start_codon:yes stop_codon:yes gene_type:complete